MTDTEIAAYIDAAAMAQGLALTPDVRTRVIAQFTLMAGIAAPVLDLELPMTTDPANVFRA